MVLVMVPLHLSTKSSCAQIYVPSTCENAVMAELDSMNYIDGINGRDEWFYHVPTQDGT